jgi:hypothetical protein
MLDLRHQRRRTGAQVEIPAKFTHKTAIFGGTFNGGELLLECSETAQYGRRSALLTPPAR